MSLSYSFLAIPQAFAASGDTFAEQTRAEATYAKCKEVETYYLAQVQKPLPDVPNPDLTRQTIFAFGRGFFWNQPNDPVFLPPEEVGVPPSLGFAQEGSYLAPRKIVCDLNEGKIRIDMKAFLLLEGKKKPLAIAQTDEFWWDGNSEAFKGQFLFFTKDRRPFFQTNADFTFRGCNADGVDCSSIDILLPLPAPSGAACADFALANYGLEVENPSAIATCSIKIDNLNYFWDKPSEVVVFEKKGRQILGPHLQVVNDVSLEVAYQDSRVLEYKGAACFMQYTSNSQQDWNNRDFDTERCSPREVISNQSLKS
ncbi:MAG: hypothetical protein Tsb0014_18860 [Pleurocapsa sp.]